MFNWRPNYAELQSDMLFFYTTQFYSSFAITTNVHEATVAQTSSSSNRSLASSELREGHRCWVNSPGALLCGQRLSFTLPRHVGMIVFQKNERLFLRTSANRTVTATKFAVFHLINADFSGCRPLVLGDSSGAGMNLAETTRWQENGSCKSLNLTFQFPKHLKLPFVLFRDCQTQILEVFVARKLDGVRPSFRWPVRS